MHYYFYGANRAALLNDLENISNSLRIFRDKNLSNLLALAIISSITQRIEEYRQPDNPSNIHKCLMKNSCYLPISQVVVVLTVAYLYSVILV